MVVMAVQEVPTKVRNAYAAQGLGFQQWDEAFKENWTDTNLQNFTVYCLREHSMMIHVSWVSKSFGISHRLTENMDLMAGSAMTNEIQRLSAHLSTKRCQSGDNDSFSRTW